MSRNVMGTPEPVLRERVESFSDPHYSAAVTWYHESLSRATRRGARKREMQGWLLEWMREAPEFTREECASAKLSKVLITHGIMSRMLSNGGNFAPELRARHVENVKESLVKRADPFARKESDPGALQRRVRAAQARLVAEFEGQLDETSEALWAGRKPPEFDAFDFLMQQDSKPSIARAIVSKWTPVLKELKGTETDVELRESYCGTQTWAVARQRVNKLAAWVEQVLWDVERFCDTSTGRTPRKKKGQSAAKLVRKMQYLRVSDEYKVSSVDPTHLVGAQSAWLFNTKSRRLTELVAQDTDGLTVSGSSVKGFNPKASQSKVVRKPEVVLKSVIDSGKGTVGKVLLNLKTATAIANGRVNQDTVILRVVR